MPIDVKFRLTATQARVLQLYAAGMTANEIATVLGVSKKTIANHMYAVRFRLRVPGTKYNALDERMTIMRAAMQLGLLKTCPVCLCATGLKVIAPDVSGGVSGKLTMPTPIEPLVLIEENVEKERSLLKYVGVDGSDEPVREV